ncbi:hypothetical protein [Castellaniella sp.]|uniref:hypothetical protein n=1 Tax=Castellaniella sp. TaxID=1955812 RepID=UPI002AFFF74A|nr:hypothetical protein [Castellaniella sp.]
MSESHIITERISDMERMRIAAETARETVRQIAYGLMDDMAERGITGAALRDVHDEMDGCIESMFAKVGQAISNEIEGLEISLKGARSAA